MLKFVTAALLMLALVSCGTAPAPTRLAAQPYSVISEQADSAAGSLTLMIRISGPPAQANVISIAESVIANRKAEYRHIIVKSYAEGMTATDTPIAISRLEDGAVTHRFNSLPESQKIKTH